MSTHTFSPGPMLAAFTRLSGASTTQHSMQTTSKAEAEQKEIEAQLKFIERGLVAIMADLYVSRKKAAEYASTIQRIRSWVEEIKLERPTPQESPSETP